MGCSYEIFDVRIFFHNQLRQKFYCCKNIQNTNIPTKRKSIATNNEIVFGTTCQTIPSDNNKPKDKIILENKYNEKISLKSDTSSIEPVYKESGFNVKH